MVKEVRRGTSSQILSPQLETFRKPWKPQDSRSRPIFKHHFSRIFVKFCWGFLFITVAPSSAQCGPWTGNACDFYTQWSDDLRSRIHSWCWQSRHHHYHFRNGCLAQPTSGLMGFLPSYDAGTDSCSGSLSVPNTQLQAVHTLTNTYVPAESS
jgi:hypothetical protein